METMCNGKNAVYNKIIELTSLKKGGAPVQNETSEDGESETKKVNAQSKTVDELIETLQVSLEMLSRGFKFKMVDMNQSEATKFVIYDDKTLLEFILETGRTHQIRLHCSSMGHPIVGDSMYGVDMNQDLMLKSYRVIFDEPYTKERIDISLIEKW